MWDLFSYSHHLTLIICWNTIVHLLSGLTALMHFIYLGLDVDEVSPRTVIARPSTGIGELVVTVTAELRISGY